MATGSRNDDGFAANDTGPDAPRMGRLDVTALLGVVKAGTLIENQTDAALREAGIGLRANEWDALVFIGSHGPLRPSELLRHTTLCVSPGTLHAVLARLEDRDLVERRGHPQSRRAVIYAITPAGEAIVAEGWPILERLIVHRFAGHFDDDELAALASLADRIG